jgi:hypothetical protein
MSALNPLEVLIAMAAGLFIIGALSAVVGMLILITRATGREVRALTTQTAQLAQKGLAEDVAGLVGNASALLSATNEMVRTTSGIGVFLTILGVLMMAAGSLLILQIR